MSVAAAQYAQFCDQAVEHRKVFTFTNSGEYLVYPVGGNEVVPFWSSRDRLVSIQRTLTKYERHQIDEMELNEFLDWIPTLEGQGILIGVNWSGERLTGYNVSVADLIAALNHRLQGHK